MKQRKMRYVPKNKKLEKIITKINRRCINKKQKMKKAVQDQGMLRFSMSSSELQQREPPLQFTDQRQSDRLPTAEAKPDEGWKQALVQMTKWLQRDE